MAPEPKKGSTKIFELKNFEISKFKKKYFCGMAPPMMYEETGGIAFQATKIPNSNHQCCCLCLTRYSAVVQKLRKYPLNSFAVTEHVLNSVLISSLFCAVVTLWFVGTVLYVFCP